MSRAEESKSFAAAVTTALCIAVHRYSEERTLTVEWHFTDGDECAFPVSEPRPDQTFDSMVEQLLSRPGDVAPDARWTEVTCRGSQSVTVTLDTRVTGLDTSGFSGDTSWFITHFLHILEEGRANGGRTVANLQALPSALHDTMTARWSGLRADEPGERHCLHRLVEAQARRTPDAPALIHRDVVTYAELNARANRLARWLSEDAGIRPGHLVGVAMGRSAELAVAVLAVLKVGAGYVPLEVSQPAARLRHIIDDLDFPLVLTTSSWSHTVADAAWDRLAVLDEEELRMAGKSGDDLEVPDDPSGVACVIYTSGTTGRPKGVLLTHQGLSNSMRWERDAYRITPRDRLLFLASFSFSLAIVELFSPLCAGAQVVIAPQETPRDGASIASLVAALGVTLLSVVPSELKLLLEEPSMRWDGLRAVITGADVLPRPVVDLYHATCPSAPLFNIYGQTESSVDGTCWICAADDDFARIPVGRPITNTTMYILDERMEPVPVGVTGELYTGGPALAHGYAGHPRLTAERFVPNPFATSPAGERLYRSGDRARWLTGGVIELLGRNDHQVQMHGVRIELEEIEAILRTHPGVRDAVVSAAALPPDWPALVSGVPADVLDAFIAEVEAL